MKIFLFFVFSLFLHAAPQEGGSLRISGSTTIQPVIEAISDEYQKATKQKLLIEGGGSENGLKQIEQKTSDIAMVSRNLSDDEKNRFGHVAIAYDALAIIHTKSKPKLNLTKEMLVKIYDGTIRECKEIGWKCENITVVSKATNRGTLVVFEAYTGLTSPRHKSLPLNAKLIRADAWEAESNLNAIFWVSGLKDSIGYVSYSDAKYHQNMSYPIHIGSIDGVSASIDTIKNRSYPLVRELNLVWDKENLKVAGFIEWSKNQLFKQTVEKFNFVAVDR